MDLNYQYFLQVLAISGIFSVFHFLCLRQNNKHGINRLILLSSLAFSLVLPLISIPVTLSGHFEIPFSAQRLVVINTSPGETAASGGFDAFHQSPDSPGIVFLLCMVISGFLFVRLCRSVWLMVKKIRRHEAVPHHNCLVIFDETTQQPFSFFTWIFIPATVQNEPDKLPAVLLHEVTHARRWHSLDKLLTETLKTVMWWNPFFFYLEKQLQLTHEYEADAAAANQTGTKQYAKVLLQHFLPGNHLAITHSFYHSPIKSRIMMLLNPAKQTARHWILIPVMGITVLIFSTSFRRTPELANLKDSFKVLVDAGHGGMDNGAGAANFKEKDLTLALAKALQQKAEGTNISIILTRNDDELPMPGNINESLKKRVSLVEDTDAEAMVSLHVGMAEPGKATDPGGVLAFVSGKNNESSKLSKPLATALLNGFTGGPLPVQPNIQQRKGQGIYVLDNNPKPAVLLEVGFITNTKDMSVLSNPAGIDKLADCILKGLQQYAGRQ